MSAAAMTSSPSTPPQSSKPYEGPVAHAASTTRWTALYRRHRWRAEGIFAEAKVQHGLLRAVRRGRWNVAIQAYLTATAINLKRLAASLSLLARCDN